MGCRNCNSKIAEPKLEDEIAICPGCNVFEREGISKFVKTGAWKIRVKRSCIGCDAGQLIDFSPTALRLLHFQHGDRVQLRQDGSRFNGTSGHYLGQTGTVWKLKEFSCTVRLDDGQKLFNDKPRRTRGKRVAIERHKMTKIETSNDPELRSKLRGPLLEFYETYKPEYVTRVDEILSSFSGNDLEKDVNQTLKTIYDGCDLTDLVGHTCKKRHGEKIPLVLRDAASLEVEHSSYRKGFTCSICRITHGGKTYHCSDCFYDLCQECAINRPDLLKAVEPDTYTDDSDSDSDEHLPPVVGGVAVDVVQRRLQDIDPIEDGTSSVCIYAFSAAGFMLLGFIMHRLTRRFRSQKPPVEPQPLEEITITE